MAQQITPQSKLWLQPLDRVALTLMVVLGLLIGGLILGGDHASARVRSFSWQDKQIGAEDTAFIMTFSRPMDTASVEANLILDPPLPGKFSWAGRRMAYTLDQPAPYGTEFKLQLRQAQDRYSATQNSDNVMQPFETAFHSRDRAFVYLGVEGDEEGRLILYNLTRQERQVLTPETLVVMDYQPYPLGDRILFAATDQASQAKGLLNQQLYTVTTGITVNPPDAKIPNQNSQPTGTTQPAGQITRVLDSDDYQNLKFHLSPDGEVIIVQRVNRDNPADFGLWSVRPGTEPQPMETEPGGDFLIAPDSNSLVLAQGEGLTILPLEPQADPLDFLPQFGMILNFARDGSAAAMLRFNRDPVNPSRSLFLVTNQGSEKELLRTDGSILDAQFDPTRSLLYCLATTVVPSDAYIEQPFLTAIDLETAEHTDLLVLPIQRDIQMSLSPDGLGLLFDQIQATDDLPPEESMIRSNEGKPIANSRLWFLPLLTDEDGTPVQTDPESLPLSGLRPRWLP